jgi:predicted nucleic acid-binding protein
MLICLDTNIVIWGILEESHPSQKEMIGRAKILIEHLTKTKTKIMLPSPVVTELLINVPPESHPPIIETINKRFIVESFDMQASLHYVRIWHLKQIQRQQAKQANIPKSNIKFDIMILAIAVAKHANVIYSHDSDIHKLGDGIIRVENLPQGQLPLDI